MATVARGPRDQFVRRIRAVLEEYERLHPKAQSALYRQNSGSIRVRIVDPRFDGLSEGERHDQVWDFLAERLDEDDIQEISMLLLLTRKEVRSSFLNSEFESPVRSNF